MPWFCHHPNFHLGRSKLCLRSCAALLFPERRMCLQTLSPFWPINTYQMQLIAYLAFFKRMINKETVQMTLLVRCQNACAFAKGAGVLKIGQNRAANKLGAVRYPLHGLQKGSIRLKGDDLLFSLFHGNLHPLPVSDFVITLCYHVLPICQEES